MNMPVHDWTWLDASQAVERGELAQMCGLSSPELDELVEYGALVPLAGAGPLRFSAGCVAPLREAARLRSDFDLDLFTAALLLGYLQRIEQLEQRVRILEAHLPQRGGAHHEGPTPWVEPHA